MTSTEKTTRGLIHDSIGDMLTRIRNACLAKKSDVKIPFTRINQQIVQILEKEGFIQTFQVILNSFESNQTLSNRETVQTNAFQKAEIIIRLKYRSKTIYNGKRRESCISNLKRISKPGLRIYANTREIPRVLGGTGIVILSTPEGIITDREARLKGIGGELLCQVW